MTDSAAPWHLDGDTLRLFVRVTPRASRDAITGPGSDSAGRAHIAVKVRAVPEDGRANAAVERLVAEWLGIGRTEVRLVAGATARLKTLEVADAVPQTVERLKALLSHRA
ncbi:MAG: DUF167 domain-containing protein [Rhizobiales bacterium]|nr:DUF167 domain-containing protein [Hyphomicrobiales bacterium]